jgi:hypothetical protein
LIISEPQATVSKLLVQYSVLFTEIFNYILLPLIHPAGQRDHNKMKWVDPFLHRLVIVSSQGQSNARTLLIRVFGPYDFHRDRMNEMGVTPAAALVNRGNGVFVRVAGCVIVRQRPGTAKGIVFLSVEDETGIFNVIVMPDIFEANRLTIVRSPYLLVEGPLQKYEGVIHVQARKIEAISLSAGAASSHDFK